MRKKIIYFGFSLLASLLLSSLASAQDNLTIIANVESVPAEMDFSKLQSILKGEQMRWSDGTKVKIALMKTNTTVGTLTSEKIYQMSGNELNKYFLALVFQGKVKAPAFFNSESELEAYIAQTPGAIGVIQNTGNDQVKIVVVDGKKQI
jgi:ABC-type phosphate transport system substrate-binding protein